MSVNDPAAVEICNTLYVQACGELFSAYGVTTELKAGDVPTRDRAGAGYVSILGATGQGIRLLSTLTLDADLLARTHRLEADDTSPRYLEDWCKELNNQLLGRVKNKLLELGCEILLGLPALVTGHDLDTVTDPGADTRVHVFACAHGRLALALATQLASGFQLDDAPCAAPDGAVMHAGGILF